MALQKGPECLCENSFSQVKLLIVRAGEGLAEGAQVIKDVEKDIVANFRCKGRDVLR